MSKLTDKASYLKGLAAGLKLNMEKDTNQLLLEVLNMLSDIAEEMEAMSDAHDELISYACPHCGHEIEFHASDVDFDEDYLCPACGKPVFPELEEDEDDGEDDKE